MAQGETLATGLEICDFLRHAVIEDLKTIAAETVNINVPFWS